MSGSRTISQSLTNTRTDARKVASRIAADIRSLRRRCGRSYPSDAKIDDYAEEAEIMLAYGCWTKIEYGYYVNRNGRRERTDAYVIYKVVGGVGDLDDPGGFNTPIEIPDDAFFWSYAWKDRDLPRGITSPIERVVGTGAVGGNHQADGTHYGSGAIGVDRYRPR